MKESSVIPEFKEFINWLEAQPDDNTYGTMDADSCPIAQFTGLEIYGNHAIQFYNKQQIYLPVEYQDFIHEWDSCQDFEIEDTLRAIRIAKMIEEENK